MKANKAKTLVAVAALALVGGAVAWGPLAHADDITVSIGSGSYYNVTDLGSGGGTVSGPIKAGNFTISDVTASDYFYPLPAPGALDSQELDVTTSSSGTLTIWVLATGLTQPLGNISSSFTTNQIFNTGYTVAESTYIGTSTAILGASSSGCTGCTQLASWTFNKSNWGTNKLFYNNLGLSGPYSLAEEYVITSAATGGTSNSTINMNFVPEPGSLGMLGLGLSALGALGWIRRRRGRNQNSV